MPTIDDIHMTDVEVLNADIRSTAERRKVGHETVASPTVLGTEKSQKLHTLMAGTQVNHNSNVGGRVNIGHTKMYFGVSPSQAQQTTPSDEPAQNPALLYQFAQVANFEEDGHVRQFNTNSNVGGMTNVGSQEMFFGALPGSSKDSGNVSSKPKFVRMVNNPM